RGPDDQGTADLKVESVGPVGCLGNTRLAILDTSSAGHQPMNDRESGNWLTYNGETYNFQQLQREIADEPGAWRSQTDTEVVLRAYRKWGIESFARLRGMFALAIWDAAKQELLLARDRFGIKPLYYATTDGNGLIFASEIRAILASGLVSRRLSHAAISSYLAYGSVQAPLTIVDGVKSLMPGQFLRVSSRAGDPLKLETGSFADGNQFPVENRLRNREEAVVKLRAELEESVRLHLVSDVPLGVFLSGGMDSSALVALMSRVSNDKPKTFSVVFDEEKFSEASRAKAVAAKFETDHREVRLTEERMFQMLPAAISALDQPSMDGINSYVVSKAVKEAGVTVALSGLGGDELFAGYPSFRRALKLQTTSALTRSLLRMASGTGRSVLNGSVKRSKFWQLAASDGQPADVYRITRQLFSPEAIKQLAQIPAGDNCEHPVQSADTINAVSELEMQGYMANTLLRDTDAMSMAHSLEVRVPIVDTNVVSYVQSLPGAWKLNGNGNRIPKPLLADALQDLLDRDFIARPKMGFTLPFEAWLQSRLAPEVSDLFAGRQQLIDSGLDANSVVQVWRDFSRAPEAVGWSRPWSLYILSKWCVLNEVTVQ
ncbi:MAG TPA: asparagine synthase (glutamine-hydrolyzing), partial [Pyrinomonadaceae bacterium]|nr:asparagine synthase (glutamine-hydrolyzing) [Pyrinomonadaceae bacterium]